MSKLKVCPATRVSGAPRLARSFVALNLLAGGFLTATTAAAPLTVENHSFEQPPLEDGEHSFTGSANDVPNWVAVGGAVGAINYTDAAFPGSTGDPGTTSLQGGAGHQAAFLDNNGSTTADGTYSWLLQDIGTVAANTVYTLTAAVGNQQNLIEEAFAIQIMAINSLGGETSLGYFEGDPESVPSGTFKDFSVTGTTSEDDPLAGQTLRIRLLNHHVHAANPEDFSYYRTNWDNVRLDATPVPEPALPALSLGALALLGHRRRVSVR